MLDTPGGKAILTFCHRFLAYDYPKTPQHILSDLAEAIDRTWRPI